MKNRLKAIRKNQHLTQDEFSQILGGSRTAYAKYENGLVIPNDTFIKLVCAKFSVNEAWLRTGEGGDAAMFRPAKNSLLGQLATEHGLSGREQRIISAFIHLDKQDRVELLRIIDKMADKMSPTQNPDQMVLFDPQTSAETAPEPPAAAAPLTPEQKEAVLAELNAHDGKKSSPSTGTNTAAN